jgi:hypothetical protein
MTQQIFPPKLSSAAIGLVFDLKSLILPGDSITAADVTATVYSGVDPTPSAIISGAASFTSTTVTQSVVDGVAGCTYLLTCSVGLTPSSRSPKLQGLLTILPTSGI